MDHLKLTSDCLTKVKVKSDKQNNIITNKTKYKCLKCL